MAWRRRSTTRTRTRRVIDWAAFILFAGGVTLFIAWLPQKQVTGDISFLDGDSFVLSGTEIRLYGIDAPEGRQTCQRANGADYQCGREASRALRNLARGKNITCSVITKDRYARNVSKCKAGNVDLNHEMVRLGWAIAYRSHSQDYARAEAEARTAKRGVWQGPFKRPQDWRHERATAATTTGDKPQPD